MGRMRLDDDHADGVDDLYVDEDHGEDEQQVVEERVDEYEYSDVEENQRAAMERASSSCTSQRVHSPSKGRTAETSITIDDSDESDGGGGGEEDAEEETIRNTQNPEADAAAAEEAEDAEGAAVPVPVVDEPGRCEEAADTVATALRVRRCSTTTTTTTTTTTLSLCKMVTRAVERLMAVERLIIMNSRSFMMTRRNFRASCF